MKKSRVYMRKRLALRWILPALVFLLVVNQLLGVCLLLPIQAAHRSADLQGIGRTHLVKRRWEPELRATGLLYLMENENALLLTDTHFGLLGWETERGAAVDCTGDAPLYVGQYDAAYEDRMVNCLFGRVDDPEIVRVEISVRAVGYAGTTETWEETASLPVEPEDFIAREEGRYFLVEDVIDNWPDNTFRQAWITAYNGGGDVVTEFQIMEGTHSHF